MTERREPSYYVAVDGRKAVSMTTAEIAAGINRGELGFGPGVGATVVREGVIAVASTQTACLTLDELIDDAMDDAIHGPPAQHLPPRHGDAMNEPTIHTTPADEPSQDDPIPEPPREPEILTLLLIPYRPRRTTPRSPEYTPEQCQKQLRLMEDPAPPWAADVAAAISRLECSPYVLSTTRSRFRCLAVGELALAWCAEGEPVSRASRVLAILDLYPNAQRLDALEAWIRCMVAVGAGRPRYQSPKHDPLRRCSPRPFMARITDATWEERDALEGVRDASAFDVGRKLLRHVLDVPPGESLEKNHPDCAEKLTHVVGVLQRYAAGRR